MNEPNKNDADPKPAKFRFSNHPTNTDCDRCNQANSAYNELGYTTFPCFEHGPYKDYFHKTLEDRPQ